MAGSCSARSALFHCRMGHLIHDLENYALASPSRRGTDELTQCPHDSSLPSDHLADVLLRHEEPQHDDIVPLLTLHADCIRIVYEPARENFQ